MTTATGAPPIVGRDEELRRVAMFLDRPSRHAPVLVLHGDAGIGKSTLWRAAVASAVERGFRVLSARPAEAERELSFSGLGDLLTDLHEELGFLPEPQRRALRVSLLLERQGSQPPAERAVGTALSSLLQHVAEAGPLLVALDDMQWLDVSTAAVLSFALRRTRNADIKVVAARRRGESALSLEGEVLEVDPLESRALGNLLRGHLGVTMSRPTLELLAEAAGGNPFYALEIGRALDRRGLVDDAPGGRLPIPAELAGLVRERLAEVPRPCREALVAAAVAPQPTLTLLRAAKASFPDDLEPAHREGLIVYDHDRLRFTHPLLPSVILASAPAAEVRATRLSLAEVARNPEERAVHLAEAALGPDEGVAILLDEARDEAHGRGAIRRAAELADRALALTPLQADGERRRRLVVAADHHFHCGNTERAERRLREALELPAGGSERARTLLQLGLVRGERESLDEARALFRQGLAEPDLEPELEAELAVHLAGYTMGTAAMPQVRNLADRALTLARAAGRERLVAEALMIQAMMCGDYEEARPLLDEGVALERAGARTWVDWSPRLSLAYHLSIIGDHAAARSLFAEVLDEVRLTDDASLITVLNNAALFEWRSGGADAARALADESLDVVAHTGRDAAEAGAALALAAVAGARGEIAATEAIAARGLARARSAGALVIVAHLTAFRAQAWLSVDQPERALEILWPEIEPRLDTESQQIWGGYLPSRVTDALTSLNRTDEAREALSAWERQSGWEAISDDARDCLRARNAAVIAAREGDLPVAIREFSRALEGEGMPVAFDTGVAALGFGTTLRRARQRAAAAARLEEALEIFERMRADPWIDRTRAELDQLGGRTRQTKRLTATEQRIADLVAAGQSNVEVADRMSLSPKTVEWNLSKIYKKLHVRGRAELAAKLARKS